ncbi:MAG TPA: hypothetical protein VJK54_08225 [Chthoniobacterales bacterium]|nr:hypothetical protein [Chthoniobacterales bacterium]
MDISRTSPSGSDLEIELPAKENQAQAQGDLVGVKVTTVVHNPKTTVQIYEKAKAAALNTARANDLVVGSSYAHRAIQRAVLLKKADSIARQAVSQQTMQLNHTIGEQSDHKNSANPSVEYGRGSTDNQGDLLNLNQRIDQPTATIRPVERIVVTTDQVHLSKETIKGVNSEDAAHKIILSKSGSFRAGTELRVQCATLLFDEMKKELERKKQSEMEDPGLVQFKKDIDRCTDFSLIDVNGSQSINVQLGSDSQGFSEAVDKVVDQLRDFVRVDVEASSKEGAISYNDYLLNAIASIANQALGNASLQILTYPLLDAALPFPLAQTKILPASIKYSLQKISHSGDFILSFDLSSHVRVVSFLNKKPESILQKITKKNFVNSCNTVDVENCTMKSNQFVSVKITSQPSFNLKEPLSVENFPCRLEVLDLSYNFQI